MESPSNLRSFLVERSFALLVAAFLMVGAVAGVALAKTAKESDASVSACLDRFYTQVPGGKEAAGRAKGLLVMPGVIKAGLIVGGEYGEGALIVGEKTVSYYKLVAGSVGLQFGGEAKDIIIMFLTDAALKQFQATEGWEAGVDGNVALVNVGAGQRIDLKQINDPIIGYVFDVKGLMADLSLSGAKFTKVEKK